MQVQDTKKLVCCNKCPSVGHGPPGVLHTPLIIYRVHGTPDMTSRSDRELSKVAMDGVSYDADILMMWFEVQFMISCTLVCSKLMLLNCKNPAFKLTET